MRESYAVYRQGVLLSLKERLESFPLGKYALELGCGHGHFLTAWAARAQAEGRELHFVGVDKNPARLERAAKKSAAAKLSVEWVEARVADVLSLWPQGRALEEIWVLFPDPWPREKQWKHRFVNADFLQALAAKAPPQGRFYFRTDHGGYFEEVERLLRESPLWREAPELSWPEGLPETVFEGHHPVFSSLLAVRR